MTAHWQQEKERIDAIRDAEAADRGGARGGRARRARRRPAAGGRAPLRHARRAREASSRPENAALAELQRDRKFLNEEVTEEDVAEVVVAVDRHPRRRG